MRRAFKLAFAFAFAASLDAGRVGEPLAEDDVEVPSGIVGAGNPVGIHGHGDAPLNGPQANGGVKSRFIITSVAGAGPRDPGKRVFVAAATLLDVVPRTLSHEADSATPLRLVSACSECACAPALGGQPANGGIR
jgi:hypothetical protein